MALKAVETIRKIRDENYKATKKLSVEDQIKLINKKAEHRWDTPQRQGPEVLKIKKVLY